MKKSFFLPIYALLAFLFSACIGDDIVFDTVEPTIRITNPLDTLGFGETHQFTFTYFNNVGQEVAVNATWSSSAPDIVAITADGLATGLSMGTASITVMFDTGEKVVMETLEVVVGEESITSPLARTGTIATTSTYKLTGDFTLEEDGAGGVILSFASNYEASTSLPGLYVYLTNNPNTSVGALEIGAVETFAGEHSYTIPNTGLQDYSHVLYFCKPFNVKVGDGEIN